ncbi:MAG TPA: DUF3135 domain-containing protein [Rhodocyclaceae bacterium]
MSASPLPRFEEMARLAQENPADFERLRATLVEDFIAHSPRRLEQRLRGLQFRIDSSRRLAKSDYGAALRVFAMMWESFESLASLWRGLPDEMQNGVKPLPRSAKVLRLGEPKPAAGADPAPDKPIRS